MWNTANFKFSPFLLQCIKGNDTGILFKTKRRLEEILLRTSHTQERANHLTIVDELTAVKAAIRVVDSGNSSH